MDTRPAPFRVLLVDDDQDVRDLVKAVLSDEGYEVSTLAESNHDSIAAAVGRIEPDCILLDGVSGPSFGDSWTHAAYLARRGRPVPTVMFTAHMAAVNEARDGSTERSSAAGFAAVVPKPFQLDELLAAVETATGRSTPFDRSDAAEEARTEALKQELAEAGASEIHTSTRREWATFISPIDDCLYQLYWWEGLGTYMVGRYDDSARLELIGRHYERRDAIDAAVRR